MYLSSKKLFNSVCLSKTYSDLNFSKNLFNPAFLSTACSNPYSSKNLFNSVFVCKTYSNLYFSKNLFECIRLFRCHCTTRAGSGRTGAETFESRKCFGWSAGGVGLNLLACGLHFMALTAYNLIPAS